MTQFATGSWDKTARVWDVETGVTTSVLKGHSSDVLSVAYTPSHKQLITASRDRTIRLWNLDGDCMNIYDAGEHKDWVTSAKVSISETPVLVSGSRDATIKVWNFNNLNATHTIACHKKPISSVDIAPDGSLCAAGSADETVCVVKTASGKQLVSFKTNAPVNDVKFSPTRYWLSAATDTSVLIWDLEACELFYELVPLQERKSLIPWANCLKWSADGSTLFVGCSDSNIYVYQMEQ